MTIGHPQRNQMNPNFQFAYNDISNTDTTNNFIRLLMHET